MPPKQILHSGLLHTSLMKLALKSNLQIFHFKVSELSLVIFLGTFTVAPKGSPLQ